MEYGASSADLYIKWKNRPRRTDPVCRGLFDWHAEEEACDHVQHHGRAGKAQDIGRLGLHAVNDVAAGGGAGHEGREAEALASGGKYKKDCNHGGHSFLNQAALYSLHIAKKSECH